METGTGTEFVYPMVNAFPAICGRELVIVLLFQEPLKPNYCIAAIYIDTVRINAVVTEYNCDRSELTLNWSKFILIIRILF